MSDEEEPEDIDPYDPFNMFGSGIFPTPPTNYSDIFSIGFGNHLADCFFFSVGDFPIHHTTARRPRLSSRGGMAKKIIFKTKRLKFAPLGVYSIIKTQVRLSSSNTPKISKMLAYKCKIRFNSEKDEEALRALMEAERKAFNFISPICKRTKAKHITVLHKEAYQKTRKKFKRCPSQVVLRAELNCVAAYNTARANKHKIDKPFVKKRLALQLDKRLYIPVKSEAELALDVTTLKRGKRIRIVPVLYPQIKHYLDRYTFHDPLLTEDNGEIYITFTFEVDSEGFAGQVNEGKPVKKSLGVDLGIRRAATTSEGVIFSDKKYNKEKRKTRYLKRCLNRSNTRSAKRHLKKIKRKEHNQTRNFVHHLTNAILVSSRASTIVMEDLSKIKSNAKQKNPHRKLKGLASVPFRMIRDFVTYKAHLHGKQVKIVSPTFTSQIDHQTGSRQGKRVGCRYYTVRKGLVFDADVNAAINIAKRANQPVSCCKALDGQALVTTPYVKHKTQTKAQLLGAVRLSEMS
jgi:IS605 OrfB family transposase